MRVAAQCLGDTVLFQYFPNTIVPEMPEWQVRVYALSRWPETAEQGSKFAGNLVVWYQTRLVPKTPPYCP